MMSSSPQDTPDAELAALNTLWGQGAATARQLTAALYSPGTNAHYATVQKLLDRLESKQCVNRDRTVWPHLFRPVIDREGLIHRRLRATADKFC
jgi:predicted transcriptional regulator